eukprot:4719132-Prymnesium_polylepis.2
MEDILHRLQTRVLGLFQSTAICGLSRNTDTRQQRCFPRWSSGIWRRPAASTSSPTGSARTRSDGSVSAARNSAQALAEGVARTFWVDGPEGLEPLLCAFDAAEAVVGYNTLGFDHLVRRCLWPVRPARVLARAPALPPHTPARAGARPVLPRRPRARAVAHVQGTSSAVGPGTGGAQNGECNHNCPIYGGRIVPKARRGSGSVRRMLISSGGQQGSRTAAVR